MRREPSLIVALSLLLACARLEAAAKPPRLFNAALPAYGARISLVWGPKGGKDKLTPPESTFDNNAHTRCVLWGEPPYTITIELLGRLPVDKVAFAHTDCDKEIAPKEVEVELDDGSRIAHTLELKRPEKRRPVWQEVPVGKEARVVKVTVKSNHAGEVAWGGLGEIAVLTSTDLDALLAIPGHDPKAPVFVRKPSIEPGKAAEVHLPKAVPKGEHPCCLMSKEERDALRETVKTAPRGKEALEQLLNVANGALEAPLDFPDPKGTPAQLTDRRCPIAKRHDALAKACGTLGMAYAMTGERKYAERAKEILLGYAQRYAAYPEHKGVNRSDTGKVMAQRLSEAMWLIPQIAALDQVWDSGALTDADRTQVADGLIRPCIEFIHRKAIAARVADCERANPDWRTADPPPGRPGPVGNWLNFYAAASILAGAVLGDRDLVDLTARDVKGYIRDGIGPDGLWGEGAIGYQMFALQALVLVLETAARQGIDLWGYRDARIKMPFDSVLRYAYPDGTAPGINDSGRVRLGDWSTMIYDYAWLRYREPGYAFLVNASPRQLLTSEGVYYPTRIYEPLPEPKAAAYPSTVFEGAGYAILRDPGRYLLVDYGPHGGVHGHFDKLNLLLFAGGDELGGEPVMHRYEDPLHRQWTIQTVAHNTVAADERSQVPCTGRLLVFEDAGPIKVMRAEAAGAYPGVLLDRTVVVLEDAVVDLFHGRSRRPHTWDRTLRFQGRLEDLAEPDKAAQPLGSRDGYEHLRVVARAGADDSWRGAWGTKGGKLHVLAAGAPGQEAIVALGPDKDHVVLVRQAGKAQASFASVYSLDAWGKPAASAKLVDTGDPLVVAFEMARDGATVQVVVAHRPGAWEALGWKSDARVLVARRKGNETQVLRAGGSETAKDGMTNDQ